MENTDEKDMERILQNYLKKLKNNWQKTVYKYVPPAHRIIEGDKVRITGEYLIKLIDWQEFETIMLYMLKKQGWEATSTNNGADGGLDAIGIKGDEKLVLQAKHWKSNVTRPALDGLMGVALREKATIAVLASSSGFTKDVREIFQVLYHSGANVNEGINLPYKVELWGNTEIKKFIDHLDDDSFDQMIEAIQEKIINRLK